MSELYKRIKQKREELGLSQDELAKRIGYKSRSSINKIESGENDIPQSKIRAFARALETTTAQLMGFVEFQKKLNDQVVFEEQLKQLGYGLGYDEDDAYLWINYPDGTLEITEDILDNLIERSKSYLKFQLEELKQNNIKDFRFKKAIDDPDS